MDKKIKSDKVMIRRDRVWYGWDDENQSKPEWSSPSSIPSSSS